MVFEQLDVAVPDVDLVLIHYQELGLFLFWIILVHDEDKVSQFFFVFIAEDEKAFFISVVVCLADGFEGAE